MLQSQTQDSANLGIKIELLNDLLIDIKLYIIKYKKFFGCKDYTDSLYHEWGATAAQWQAWGKMYMNEAETAFKNNDKKWF